MTLDSLGFRVKKRPGFEDVEFSQDSRNFLDWQKAVKFAATRGTGFVLQSAREAVAFRVEARGQDNANLHQITRTTAIYSLLDGKLSVAFDEDPDPNKNLVLQGRLGLFSKSDISDVLARAEKANRIIEVKENHLKRRVKADQRGRSAYGQDPLIQAVLLDMAEENAHYIAQKYEGLIPQEYRVGHAHLPYGFKKQLKHDQVSVQPVCLGGSDFKYFSSTNHLFAYNKHDGGWARGVRNTTPPQLKS